jgi:dihydroorotase-like cyclic amidohydrolase
MTVHRSLGLNGVVDAITTDHAPPVVHEKEVKFGRSPGAPSAWTPLWD